MVFITTGQRIATENFSDGVIYKVTFVNATISYMMCVGIGQDFVMLQGPNPSLFCLTMSSASRVSTIDVHDPTPPTPIENALQYQTGEPPFTFTTTESSLFSWYIEGPCGVKTANLFNKNDSDILIGYEISTSGITENSDWFVSGYIPVEYGATYYKNYNNGGRLLIYDSAKTELGSALFSNNAYTVNSNNVKYIRINNTKSAINTYMLNDISASEPYEPYGYKISILSNDNAETIYLDEALAEGERLYSVNIDTVVVTDIGENTLSVTPTPPEMQIVYGIYAEA